MSVHVIIPWHGGNDDQRLGVLGFVQHEWRAWFPDWPQSIGMLSADSDWCKADAVELGIRASGAVDDDVLVIADADVWVAAADVAIAVQAVEQGDADWAMPHRLVHRLSKAATEAVLDEYPIGIEPALEAYGYDRQPYVGTVGGGMTILRLASYRECPLDPRFVGWGQEDESWGEALRTVLGHRFRGMADLWHLWHEPLPRMAPGVGNTQGMYVRDQYRRCNGDPARMRRLIESGREFIIG